MTRYLLSRISQAGLVVVGSVVLVFSLLHVVTEPADVALPIGASAASVAAFNEDYGFDKPLVPRLVAFLSDAAHGDFGESIIYRQDALSVVVERLPATLMVAGSALAVSLLLGIGLGTLAARKPQAKVSLALRIGSNAGISIADFWFGIMLILLFSVQLKVLPTGGYYPKPQALVLPVLVASLRPTARFFEVTRSTMLGEYERDYVLAARARGLTETAVAWRHVLRNASIPIVTLVFYEMARLISSVAVIEIVFAWPGIGNLAVTALTRGDVFLVQASVVTAAVATASLNLFADLLYFRLDPRTQWLVKR